MFSLDCDWGESLYLYMFMGSLCMFKGNIQDTERQDNIKLSKDLSISLGGSESDPLLLVHELKQYVDFVTYIEQDQGEPFVAIHACGLCR
jgi:hypothetical protein